MRRYLLSPKFADHNPFRYRLPTVGSRFLGESPFCRVGPFVGASCVDCGAANGRAGCTPIDRVAALDAADMTSADKALPAPGLACVCDKISAKTDGLVCSGIFGCIKVSARAVDVRLVVARIGGVVTSDKFV